MGGGNAGRFRLLAQRSAIRDQPPRPRRSRSCDRALASGLLELKSKLGPVLWQMAPSKKFDPADFAAFLALLPPELDGRSIRHVVEVRHESFLVPSFIALLRKFLVAVAVVDSEKHPLIADV